MLCQIDQTKPFGDFDSVTTWNAFLLLHLLFKKIYLLDFTLCVINKKSQAYQDNHTLSSGDVIFFGGGGGGTLCRYAFMIAHFHYLDELAGEVGIRS